jgi:hypothetical protein
VIAVCAATLAVLVGLNAGFIFLEQSPHVSGPAKDVIVLVFALLHEVVDHVASPLIVSVVVVASASARSRKSGLHSSTIFVAAVAVEVANSVLAPVIAQLGFSDGCYRDKLFARPEPIATSVNVQYCTGLDKTSAASCQNYGFQWLT